MAETVLLGAGNPLLDISAKVPTSMLAKYEVKSGDIILADEKHLGVYEELVKDFSVDYIAGGATQNSIRVASWMLSRHGEAKKCAFVGCVGADANGEKLAEVATAAGVTVAYQIDTSTPTGLCAVLIDDSNERTLITRLDAANNFNKAHLESEAVGAVLAEAKVVYSAGFFLTSGGPECTQFLGEHCVANGKRYCLNLSAPFLMQFFMPQFEATLPYVDILFGNETEAAALGEARGWGTDPSAVALKAAAMPKASGAFARMVVVTQGAASTLVALNGAVTSYAVPAVPKESIVDTNGAGDAFVGGFLAEYVLGASIDKCVEAGHWAARTIIQRSGCTMPASCDFVSEMPR